MANKKNKKVVEHKEVLILKLVILFAVLLVPLALVLLFSFNQPFLVLKTSFDKPVNNVINSESESLDGTFEAALPAERIGDLSNVSDDKINSLFNNLKTN